MAAAPRRPAGVRMAAVALAVLAALSLASCRGGGGKDEFALDGSARVPDDEGVVTKVDHDHITLDGKRTYKVSKNLAAFSTYTLQAVPLLGRLNQYVQIGVAGKTMTWLASIGTVVKQPDGRSTVYYTGKFKERLGDEQVLFRGGTVVRVDKSTPTPAVDRQVRAEIDPGTKKARLVEL